MVLDPRHKVELFTLIIGNGLIETEAEIILEQLAKVPVHVNTVLIDGLTLIVFVVAPVLHK
jgi:hypothetical protein